jgi:hypothetical protein
MYSYKFMLHPTRLAVAIYVGISSEYHAKFPHVFANPREDTAEVYFPTLPINHADIAHEGVHLTAWGIERTVEMDWHVLIPKLDISRKRGYYAMREEAQARMMDRYIDTFYYHAGENGLVIAPDARVGRRK